VETEAKRNYQLSLNNLKNWAGIPEEDNFAIDGSLTHYPLKPEKMDFPTVLNLRPDYNALLWEEKLMKTNVSAQKASYFPTLTGSLIAAFSSQSDYWRFDQKNYTYVAGLTLSVPIFTGGYTSAQVEKARIELEKTRVRINKSRQDIYNEMDNIYLRIDEAHERIVSAEMTLQAAEKAFTIAETTTQSGLTTQLELKDARVGFDQAQLNYYAAIFDYLFAYFDWERATARSD
jgi:outer membrane protein TolC